MIHRYVKYWVVVLLLFVILGFAVVSEASPPSALPVEVRSATYAHGLTEEMAPVDADPTSMFAPDETIYLSVQVKGRPKTGVMTAKFYWNDEFIANASIDLAEVNSGVLFSIGQDTYVGYHLSHEQPLPIGDKYYAELYYNDVLIDTYPFYVGVTPGTVVPQVKTVILARGADADYQPVNPTEIFTTDEKAFIVVNCDLALGTKIRSDWYVNGELPDNGTFEITSPDNLPDTGLYFSFFPQGGWPLGEQYVVLTLDGKEVGTFAFTIEEPFFDKLAFLDIFPLPENAQIVESAEEYDGGFVSSMTEPELFDAYGEWLKGQGWAEQAPTEAMTTLPHKVWRIKGAELLLEVRGTDLKENTEVWFMVTKTEPFTKDSIETVTPKTGTFSMTEEGE